MGVDSLHKDYINNAGAWSLVRDCIQGEIAIKAGKKTYLPKPVAMTDQEYLDYILRAEYVNFTGRTAESLHGAMFDGVTFTPTNDSGFIDLIENVDKVGASLIDFTRSITRDVLPAPYGGILVDCPAAKEGTSQAEAKRLNITAYLKYYPAESYTNKGYEIINNKAVLTRVVLKEAYEVPNSKDEFTPTQEIRYRVLRLTDNKYTQQVYTKADGKWSGGEIITPEMNSKPLDFIPFYPILGNQPEKSILLDLANANLGHYRGSADLENILHLTCAPTGWSNLPIPIDKETGKPETFIYGGRTMVRLGDKEGRLDFLEPSGSSIAHKMRNQEAKENRMKTLGAKLLDTPRQETATSTRINAAAANSVLGNLADEISESVTNAMRAAAEWRGIDASKWEFHLQNKYDTDKIEMQRLALEKIDDGVMSKVRYLEKFEGMTEEEAKAEVKRIREEGRIPYEGE